MRRTIGNANCSKKKVPDPHDVLSETRMVPQKEVLKPYNIKNLKWTEHQISYSSWFLLKYSNTIRKKKTNRHLILSSKGQRYDVFFVSDNQLSLMEINLFYFWEKYLFI